MIGRYAPSPTGPLHLGNLRTALLAWLQVRLVDGVFILRMEDLDEPRCSDAAASKIVEDLRWLGLDWDEGPDCGGVNAPYVQSHRKHHYHHALEQLVDQGDVFACRCSRKDIAAAVSAPHGPEGPIYAGTCRGHKVVAGSNLIAGESDESARDFALRLRVNQHKIAFQDQVVGMAVVDMASASGDFVIRRRDGLFAYQLAVAVDDASMGVTDVLRGEDLLDSTARQLLILDRLKLSRPRYWHVPLMTDDNGKRLSKRDASTSLDHYREASMTAAQVVGQLASSLGLVESGVATTPVDLLNRLADDQPLQVLLERGNRGRSS